MKNCIALGFCLFSSINAVNAGNFKDRGKVTFLGEIVESGCHVNNETSRVVSLGNINSPDIPFQIQFSNCKKGQSPNATFSVHDINNSKSEKLISTYFKNNDTVAPNIALELLDENKQALHIAGKNYEFAKVTAEKYANLNFTARYVPQGKVENGKNIDSTVISAINFVINYH